jgi:hypothetical protein
VRTGARARGGHPVEAQRVLPPCGDFSSVDAARFPLLRSIDTPPGPVGSPWGDQRVLEGCRLAVALADVWIELQLASLAPLPRADEYGQPPHSYELQTRSGVRILWGLPPGDSPADRTLLDAKVARLRKSLSELNGRDAGQSVIHLEGLDGGPEENFGSALAPVEIAPARGDSR